MTYARPWILVAALAACATTPPAPVSAPCPACTCACQPATTTTNTAAVGSRDEVQELMRSATRKMNHDDGSGCLADLDRVQALAPSSGDGLTLLRGQCEMLSGSCQAGKRRIVEHMRVETNTQVERAEATAEAIAALYCRGGDASERDRLLAALQALQTAAYVETRTPAECRAAWTTVRTLAPQVKPRDVDDHQVANAERGLYAAVPNCLARAGDCAGAWQAHGELFPQAGLQSVDAKVRAEVLGSAFDSLVPRCKGTRG